MSDLTTSSDVDSFLSSQDKAEMRGRLDLGNSSTKDVGTTAGTVAAGDDSRLSDDRNPTSHAHGNISNAGTIGSTAGLPIKTGDNGVLEAGAFGTESGQFAEGNHTHAQLHDAATATGNGISLSGQEFSLSFGHTAATVKPGNVTPVALNYADTLSPALGDGVFRAITMTGDATLNAPSGTPEDGATWKARFTADGAARSLTLNAAIKTPTGFTWLAEIASGAVREIVLRYSDSTWWVEKNLEFVP